MRVATENLIEEIQQEYSKIKSKSEFIKRLSKVVNRTPNTIRHHWIGQFWSIPLEFQELVLEEIKKELTE